MKRFSSPFLFLFVLVILLITFSTSAWAIKKNSTVPYQAVDATTIDGTTYIYGSVLDPNVNQVLFLLPKPLLYSIRKLGLSKLNINVTSALDSTRTYSIPLNATSIQTKKINKKFGKYFVINLSNLTTPSGITISPSSLQTGDYRLRLIGQGLDLTTKTFNYQTPVLIVGTVKSNSTGFVTVENLEGDLISDKTVAISPNGAFLTEVKANKIGLTPDEKDRKKLNKKLKLQTSESTDEEISTNNEGEKINKGIVHAVTDKDLFAVVPLDNNVENNAAKVDKPVEISEASTLTATLGKEYEVIADGIAEDELKKLETVEAPQETFTDFGCDIYLFSSRCNTSDKNVLANIGADFKKFTETATCDFPKFNLLKNIIGQAPEDANASIGKGYCETVESTQEEDVDKPCEEYTELLEDFRSGAITQLPCPPANCEEFDNLKLPRCERPIEFCEEIKGVPPRAPGVASVCRGPRCKTQFCINKPVRDLYCARVGIDVSEIECKSGLDVKGRLASWEIVTNSKGNQYCVPTNVNQSFTPTAFFSGPQNQLTKQQLAEECEVSACHRNCEDKFLTNPPISPDIRAQVEQPFRCEVCDCHFNCDAEAGRVIDCGNPRSKYFSIKCCSRGVIGPTLFTQTSSTNFSTQQFPPAPRGGVIFQDIRGCLCNDTNNFSNNGFIKEEAQNNCKDKCPPGYEKAKDTDVCLISCSFGQVRDPRGFCRRECPEGFIQDEGGNCRCPEGSTIGRGGRCEPLKNTCPEYCKNYIQPQPSQPFTSTPVSSTFSSSIPPECQRCLGGVGTGLCAPGQKRDPQTGQCISETKCGQDQYLDSNGVCRCNYDSSVATGFGPEGCKKQNVCTSNMLPNNVPGEAQCICPQGLPYWNNSQNLCVATCPNGPPPPSASAGILPRSPIPCGTGSQTQCTGGTPYLYKGTCIASCPIGLVPGTPTGSSPSTTGSCPPASPFKCSDGRCVITLVECTTSTPTGTCPGATPFKCTDGTCAVTSTTCPSTTGSCPPASPFKCSDGRCVVTLVECTTSTPTGTCPGATPFKCSDGTCVVTGTTCPSTTTSPAHDLHPAHRKLRADLKASHDFGSQLECLCPGLIKPDANGQCSTSQRPCGLDEPYNPTNPCTCALGATPSGVNNSCQCTTTGQTYSVTGCSSTTSTNYCSPNILVGTAGCTCNPSGGTSNSTGYCTCLSGSNQTYTKEYGCSSTTSTNYCSPNILVGTAGCTCNPSGGTSNSTGYCICLSGSSSYTKESGCASTSLRPCTINEGPSNGCSCFGTGFVGTDGKCQCTGGVTYTGGGCGTTTTNHCAPAISTTTGCTCALGATPSGANSTCQCTIAGQTYSVTGCSSATSTNYCSPNILVGTAGCTCNPSGGTSNSTGYCTCLSGSGSYTKESGCQTTTNHCGPAISTTTGCTCALGATPSGANSTCICTTIGQTYSSTGCTSGTTTTYCGVEIAPSTGNCTCALGATSPTGTTPCTCTTAGQTYTPSGCSSSTSTPPSSPTGLTAASTTSGTVNLNWFDNSTNETYFSIYRRLSGNAAWIIVTSAVAVSITTYTDSGLPAGTYEYHVNACNASGCSSDSNIATVTVTSPVITLTSVTISGSNVTISHSADPYVCVLVKDTNNNTLKSANLCGVGSFNSVLPTSDFTPALVSGTQVKLCNQNDSTNCSSLVAVTGGS